MALLSEFYGSGKYSLRKASVHREDGKLLVVMVDDSKVVEERDLSNHSQMFAEDTAENWVMGVIQI